MKRYFIVYSYKGKKQSDLLFFTKEQCLSFLGFFIDLENNDYKVLDFGVAYV